MKYEYWVVGVLIIIFLSSGEGFARRNPAHYPDDTLSSWTNRCFSCFKEYASPGVGMFAVPDVASELRTSFKKLNFSGESFERLLTDYKNQAVAKYFNGNEDALKKSPPEIEKKDFVVKLKVDPGTKICLVGDIHGSLHSLLRNLIRLVKLGFLTNDFRIPETKNAYIVFLGDYTDRGRYGIEVLATLLWLKLLNWDRVFLLRGNHEIWDSINLQYGFNIECIIKLTDRSLEEPDLLAPAHIIQCIQDLYAFLPIALFIECGGIVAQCCHGGICPDYHYRLLPPEKNREIDTVLPERLPTHPQYQPAPDNPLKNFFYSSVLFTWGDLEFIGSRFSISTAMRADAEGFGPHGVLGFFREDISHYLTDELVKILFRGHQHGEFGLKMVYVDQFGLHHWQDVVKKKFEEIRKEGPDWRTTLPGYEIKIHEHWPVFTFSTASEGVMLPYDCFGVVTVGREFDNWTLKVYEYTLSTVRDNKYARILDDILTQTGVPTSAWTDSADDGARVQIDSDVSSISGGEAEGVRQLQVLHAVLMKARDSSAQLVRALGGLGMGVRKGGRAKRPSRPRSKSMFYL